MSHNFVYLNVDWDNMKYLKGCNSFPECLLMSEMLHSIRNGYPIAVIQTMILADYHYIVFLLHW